MQGKTALHLAAQKGDKAAVEALIAAGSDCTAIDVSCQRRVSESWQAEGKSDLTVKYRPD